MSATDKNALIEKYFGEIDNLPTLPYIVIQLLEKMRNPDPDIEELADLIMTDQVLTTQMISMVNSAFWGLSREITSIRETIIYLGLRQIENLVYSVSLANTFERDAPLLKRVRFWEHSFGCAMFSRIIAKKIGYEDEEVAYLAGLLHDIGEVILALYLSDKFEKIVELVMDQEITFIKAETKVLGINHTDLGEWLVLKWKLSVPLSKVISSHHDVETCTEDPVLTCIVRLADLICIYHQLDFGITESENITTEIVKVWKRLIKLNPALKKINIKEFMNQFDEEVDNVKNIIGNVYTSDVDV